MCVLKNNEKVEMVEETCVSEDGVFPRRSPTVDVYITASFSQKHVSQSTGSSDDYLSNTITSK